VKREKARILNAREYYAAPARATWLAHCAPSAMAVRVASWKKSLPESFDTAVSSSN
jgi:hypothetical protein